MLLLSFLLNLIRTSNHFGEILLPCKIFNDGASNLSNEQQVTNYVGENVVQYTAYGAIHRHIDTIYNTFDTQQDLVYTGHTQDISSLVIPSTGLMYNPTDVIFGGDTYIGYYCETRAMKNDGPTMNGLDGNGPNYCAGINQNNNSYGLINATQDHRQIGSCCNLASNYDCAYGDCSNLSLNQFEKH